MGLTGSKIKQSLEDVHERNIPSTPISTPKVYKNNELDPRSPSTHLSRTPLQLLSAAVEILEELKENELYVSEEVTEVELCGEDNETPVKNKAVLLGIDPRSPTTEFKRTPIVINVEESALPKRIHNKNLDKVRQSLVIGTPKSTTEKSTIEKLPANIVPPKLLESSPLKSKSDPKTDLDAVLLEKCRIKEKSLDEAVTPHKDHVSLIKSENGDARSPTNDFLRKPILLIEKIDGTELSDEAEIKSDDTKTVESKPVMKVQDRDMLEKIEVEKVIQEICEVIHIEMEKEQPNKAVNNVENEKTYLSTSKHDLQIEEEIIGQLEDEKFITRVAPLEVSEIQIPKQIQSAPVTPPSNAIKLKSIPVISPIGKEIKSAPVTPPQVNITADVNELDKKLTNLIYQDEDVIICPRIVELKEHMNRSPLGNCNRTVPEKRKSAHKLKVSDKPRKSDFAVSKIPVFKEKVEGQVQCENTPPRNMEKGKVKPKKSYWDNADTTLII